MSVVVIDDHPAIVAGVLSWCEKSDPRITVIAAGDKVNLAWTGAGAEARIIVLDLQLTGPRLAYAELRQLSKSGRSVIVYSHLTDHEVARRSLDLGAFTFLTKCEGEAHLIPAIIAASQCLPYVSPSLGGAMVSDNSPDRPALSDREIAALTAWFQCSSKRMAAARLNISLHSLKTYIDRARLKYAAVGRAAPTKADLLKRAHQDGLIDW